MDSQGWAESQEEHRLRVMGGKALGASLCRSCWGQVSPQGHNPPITAPDVTLAPLSWPRAIKDFVTRAFKKKKPSWCVGALCSKKWDSCP